MRNGPNTPFASFASPELVSDSDAGFGELAPALALVGALAALAGASGAALAGSAEGVGCGARFTGLVAGAGVGNGSNAALPVFGAASGAFGAGVGAVGGSVGAGASGGPGGTGAGLGSANGGGASGGLVGAAGGLSGPGGAPWAQAVRAASTRTKAGNQATGDVAFLAGRNRPLLGAEP